MERLCPRIGDGVMAVRDVVQAAAGVGGAGAATYVEDVFSTYLYTGNGTSQTIENGIALGNNFVGTTLHLTGDNLTDSSPVPVAVTVVGNTQVSSANQHFGTNTLYFDGSGDWLTTDSTSGFDATKPFTIEFWTYASSYNLISWVNTDNSYFYIETFNGTLYIGDGLVNNISTTPPSTNTWVHVAVSYDGTTYRLFYNGVQQGSSTTSLRQTNANGWYVGSKANGTRNFNGYIDDLRVTKGKALYTANFTAPTAPLPIDSQTVVEGQGGLVWIKNRSNALDNLLFDTERGATKYLKSNTADDQLTAADTLTSFNADGFSLSTSILANGSAYGKYVSWTLRKAPKFFTVVTYTGGGSTQTIPHDLGGAVGCMFVKAYSGASSNWFVWHRGLATPASQRMQLNQTNAVFTDTGIWNNTSPTSTDFYVGAGGGNRANDSGVQYIAYLFAHNDAGGFGDDGQQNVISCGSYTGNGLSDGPEINLGFEPQWVLVKNSSASSRDGVPMWWFIYDTMRGMTADGNGQRLMPNLSDAEVGSNFAPAPTSTGFKLKDNNRLTNYSGDTYIYIAIRRPMKPPESGTEVFAIGQGDGDADIPDFISNFPVDASITKRTSSGNNGRMSSRLTGANYLSPNLTQVESADGAATFDFMNGWGSDGANRNTDEYAWMFRRAPGFMDVVCYTGTGVAGHVVNHNLGVAPEWIITKRRSSGGSFLDWYTVSSVYYNTIPYDRQSALNGLNGFTGGGYISGADSTSFTLKNTAVGNESGASIIAYLFASVPNVSKVGTYTGTGSDVNVDCGFSSGARFVYVQRADATGTGKYVWDSARGIVSGNDPYLLINSTAAEEPNTDYIDPLASGFTVTSNASSTINISGAIYFFLAIA